MSKHFNSMGKDECQPIDGYVNTFQLMEKYEKMRLTDRQTDRYVSLSVSPALFLFSNSPSLHISVTSILSPLLSSFSLPLQDHCVKWR